MQKSASFAATLLSVVNGQTLITQKLTSAYTSSAYMGSPLQDSTETVFYYDWSQPLTLVTRSDCIVNTECQSTSPYYDESASSTSAPFPDKDGSINGISATAVTDVVCLQDNGTTCTNKDYLFWQTYKDTAAYQYNPQNGIIGLGKPTDTSASIV